MTSSGSFGTTCGRTRLKPLPALLDAVDESIEAICRMPYTGGAKHCKNPILSGLRSWPVRDFEDILIYYVVAPDALRVVRVLHGRRDIEKILGQQKGDEARH